MTILSEGEFHIQQIAGKVEALTTALSDRDVVTIGLSLQTLSIAAQIARSQFTPAHHEVALSWTNWLIGLSFLQNCCDGVMDGDPDIVALSHELISLSHEEYLHLIALSEVVDRKTP